MPITASIPNMSIAVLPDVSSAFFEVEGRRYDTNDRLIPDRYSMALLSPNNRLIPANRVVGLASAQGPLRDGWGLGGVSPKQSMIFVAYLVEFQVGRKMNLGQGDSFGMVGPVRGIGQDFVLYAFSQEVGKAGRDPISCLVVPYADSQNRIPFRFWLRRLFRYQSLPSISDFDVPYPQPRRESIISSPNPPPSNALTSSNSILGGGSEMMGSEVSGPVDVEEQDIGEGDRQTVGSGSAALEGGALE